MPDQDNMKHAHRHAVRAYEDFKALQRFTSAQKRVALLHSLSHHLRHAIWRTGQELQREERTYIPRSK